MKKLWQNPEYRSRMSAAHKGKKWTEKQRKSIVNSLPKGENHWAYKKFKGISAPSHLINAKPPKGENHYRWIKDRSKLKKSDRRNDSLYREWRANVWKRDAFKCKLANQDCQGRIEAHHILNWQNFPEFRYQLNNGITVCHAHHPRKRAEEKQLVPIFNELVLASTR